MVARMNARDDASFDGRCVRLVYLHSARRALPCMVYTEYNAKREAMAIEASLMDEAPEAYRLFLEHQATKVVLSV